MTVEPRSDGKKHVVVVGAGVAGLYVAQKVRKESDVHVTLVTDKDCFVFLPRLTELFSGSIEEKKACLQLKDVWKGDLITDKVTMVQPQDKKILLNSGESISYDALVLSIGSQPNFFNTPGSQYCHSFYSKDDADKLKEHVRNLLTADEQPGTHTFTIIGGGPTGVEVAFVVASYVRSQKATSKVLLIERNPSVLNMMPQQMRDEVTKVLEKNGVTILPNTGVKNVTPLSVEIEKQDGVKETIPCYTTIWAAGSKPQQVGIAGVELSARGEIPVKPTLQLQNFNDIFALGDCAATGSPKTAQAAVQQAAVVSSNVHKMLRGKELDQFAFKDKGTIIALEKETVGLIYGKVISGFISRQIRDKYYSFVLGNYK